MALVQTVQYTPATGTTHVINVERTMPGSLLVIGHGVDTAAEAATSVIDNNGNTWQTAYSTTTNFTNQLWYARNTNPITQITVIVPNGIFTHIFFFREYSKMFKTTTTLDRTVTSTGLSTNITTGNSSVTQWPDELLVVTAGHGDGTVSAGSGYGNFITATIAGTVTYSMEDQVITTKDNYAGTFTASIASNYNVGLASFVINNAENVENSRLRPYPFSPGFAR